MRAPRGPSPTLPVAVAPSRPRRSLGRVSVTAILAAMLIATVLPTPLSARRAPAAPAALPTRAQDAAHIEAPEAPPLELVQASVAEAEALNRLAMGANWTSRALAVMRLERYDCEASAGRLRAFLLDPSWRVRSYAVACLARRGVTLAPETLTTESDPRVVRAMSRARYPVPAEHRDRVIAAAERSTKPLEAIVALETLAAVDTPADPKLRKRLDELLGRVVLRMSRAEGGTLSGRLAEVTSGPDSGRDYRWREWYRKSKSNPGFRPCALVPTSPAGVRLVERNRIATLDETQFIAFERYLGAIAERSMDLAILLDCTSSMWREISDAQGSIDDLMEFLGSVTKGVRIGIVGYRDRTDEWETKAWDFTPSLDEARTRLWSLSAGGGGDAPESVHAAMKLALTRFSWIKDPPKPASPPIRACVLVGDAPPHPGEGNPCIDLAKRGLAAGVRFYGIVARESEKNLKEEDPEGAPRRDAEAVPESSPEDETTSDPKKDPKEDPKENPKNDPGTSTPEEQDRGQRKPAERATDENGGSGGKRRPTDAPIAPPKAPPPVAQEEHSYTWFPEIAEAGGGRAEILDARDSLVAEIAELTIADRYRAEFADFFAAFRLLCR